jgi:hypothetical protein
MPFAWPWNSLRKAYVSWQMLEHRLGAARQELERRYVDGLRVAESLHLDPDLGLLRAARLALERPLEPAALQARERLHKAFAFLGKSFWRPAPDDLQMVSRRYASHIEALCREYEEMGARLVAAQKIIDRWLQNSASGGIQDIRLAFISPEAADLFHQLREKQGAERQGRKDCLVREWRIRLTACRRWLSLLGDSLPAGTYRKFNRSLTELADKAAGEERQEVSELLADQTKLDLLIAVANRQATRAIAELLPRKNS